MSSSDWLRRGHLTGQSASSSPMRRWPVSEDSPAIRSEQESGVGERSQATRRNPPQLCFAQLILYKAYFSTFQSLCQVSQEDSSTRLTFSQFVASSRTGEQFLQRNAPSASFLSRHCIHMNTLSPPESPLPRPGKRSSAGGIMSNSGRFP